MWGFNPILKNCEITDMTITGDLRIGSEQGILQLQGARRVFVRRTTISEDVAYGGIPGGGLRSTCPILTIGCVDVTLEDSLGVLLRPLAHIPRPVAPTLMAGRCLPATIS